MITIVRRAHNHLHLLVEANDRRALARGLQGLTIRMAKALNRVMDRKGSVFSDRYHARVLRTPREVANARAYVFGNGRRHAAQVGRTWRSNEEDPFCSITVKEGTVAPRSWLLNMGWKCPSP